MIDSPVRAFLVTGTDTEIGKTNVSCGLLRLASRQGLQSTGLKPVSAGCHSTDEGFRNDDALSLIAASGVKLPYDTVNPWAFEPPISPHIAAARVGISQIGLQPISDSLNQARDQANWIVVEGFGGWYAPLDATRTFADLANALRLPVILVVGCRLGCLNHADLTARAIARDGLALAGWVANQIDSDMAAFEENIARLRQSLQAPCLGVVRHGCIDADRVADCLRLP